MIEGRASLTFSGEEEAHDLEPGSYFRSTGDVWHRVTATEEGDCVLYVRTRGPISVFPLRRSE